MAVVGFLGPSADEGITFEVSSQKTETISEWKWSGSARYSTHSIHMGNSLTEYEGLDPDEISFDIVLMVEHGAKPLEDIAKIWNWERTGEPLALTIGDHKYGRYRWSIVSHDAEINYTDSEGNIAGATVSLTLQEYLKGIEMIPKVWVYKKEA